MASRSFIDYLLNPGPDEVDLKEAIRAAAGVADDIAAAFVQIDAAIAATAADVVTVNAQVVYVEGLMADFNVDAAAAIAAIATDRAAALAAIGAASTTAQGAIDASVATAISTVNTARDDAVDAADAAVVTVNATVTAAQAALNATGASITTDLNIIKADTEQFGIEASDARDEAVAAAASVNVPVIAPGDAGKVLTVKPDESGTEWIDAGVDLPAGGTTGQALFKASNDDQDAEWQNLPAATDLQAGIVEMATSAEALAVVDNRAISPAKASELIDFKARFLAAVDIKRHNNILPHGSFARGWSDWAAPANSANAVNIMTIDTDTNGVIETYFGRAKMQLAAEATGRTLYVGSSRQVRVDPSQRYAIGAALTTYGGSITADIRVKCYNENQALIGTLNIPATVPSGPSVDAMSNYFLGAINPEGGAAPAWPAGTVCAIPQVGYVSTAAQGLNVWAFWCIPQDEYPGNVQTLAPANGGLGTHEAVADATHLYILNHVFNWLVKFDADGKYVSHITIGDYPHDIVSIGDKLWVTNQDDMNVRRVDKATFTVDATYSIPGARLGFGLGTDGTRLWSGAGTTAQTPAIHEVNTATGVMTLLTTDVDGGGANLPVRFLDGSVWSIKQTPSEVKRINPAGGATIATISAAVGGIYGLGAGSGYVFANGRHGVAQIDPATNTVVKRYPYREGAIGHSNIEVANGFAYACSSNGVLIIDIARRTARELILDSGNNKWARALPGKTDVIVGSYCAPWLYVVGTP